MQFTNELSILHPWCPRGSPLHSYSIASRKSIGQGGFAAVYLGEHVYLGSYAAVKVLSVPLAQEAVTDFVAEARTLVGLTHLHIIRLLDYGVEGSTPFLVMDYTIGGTLRQRHPWGNGFLLQPWRPTSSR